MTGLSNAMSHDQLERALEFVTDAFDKAKDPEMKCVLRGAIVAIQEKQARDDAERAALCDDSPCKECKRATCPANVNVGCAKWRFWFREHWELTVERIMHGKKRR